MFDMGFLELLLIGIIALIVLGPERLPKAARTLGIWIGKAKQGFDSIKTEIDRELKVKELQQQLAEEKAKLESELNIGSELGSLKDELDQTVNNIHSPLSSVSAAETETTITDQPFDSSSKKKASQPSDRLSKDEPVDGKK